MRAMSQPRSWKYMLAGTLAGASGAAGLLVVLTIGLSIGLLWQYAFYRNIPVLNDRAASTMSDDVRRLPEFLWGTRWIVLGMVLSGIPLARMERFAQRYPPPLRDRLTAVALLAVVCAVVLSVLLTQTDRSIYESIGRSEGSSLPDLQELQNSVWYLIMIGIALALAIGGALWLYWSWWYQHWRRWLRLDAPPAHVDAPELSPDDWFARRQAREKRLRLILLLLAGSVLFTAAAVAGYEYVRTTIRSGDLAVQPAAPAAAARLALVWPTRALVVENTFGTGTATVNLLSASDRAPVAGPAELAFADSTLGSQRVPLSIADLPPGDYLLTAQLGTGAGGRVGYALAQGYSAIVPIAGLLVGLGVGVLLALLVLLFGVIAEQRLTDRSDRM
jgi:hypothetical protein